jgi:dephospho-CoA kinase
MKNIALNGKLACGKSEQARLLHEELGYSILSIGTMIKKVTNLLIEDPMQWKMYLENTIQNKKAVDAIYSEVQTTFHDTFQYASFEKTSEVNYVKNDWYRELAQYIATSFREVLGEDIWVTFIAKEASILAKKGEMVVCDDLRFPSEKKIFEEFGFKIIRLDVSKEVQKQRISHRGDGVINEKQLNHISETALDDAIFDLRINTDNISIQGIKEKIFGFIG